VDHRGEASRKDEESMTAVETTGKSASPPPTEDEPDLETLEEWASDCGCEATDGCWVEPDGTCEHGHPSWLIRLGFI
jgi:hypothetical protein